MSGTECLCQVPDCIRPVRSRGWCAMHWSRWKRHGDATAELPPRRETPLEVRLWRRVTRGETDTCWEWTGYRNPKGYGHIQTASPRRVMRLAHRVAWELTHGPIPDGLSVLHRCDNPPCCNPRHLFLGTVQDNNADMRAKGRQARGGGVPQAKLTPEKAREIEARYLRGGVLQKELAAEYGVHQMTVSRIVRGKQWVVR